MLCINWRKTIALLCFYRFLLFLQFVSHPNVQQLLASIWYEGLPGFRQKNMILQVKTNQKVHLWNNERCYQGLEVCRIGFLFPFFSLSYIICPWTGVSKMMRKPFIKFICNSASYFIFLCEWSWRFTNWCWTLHIMYIWTSLILINEKLFNPNQNIFSSTDSGLSKNRRYYWLGPPIRHH